MNRLCTICARGGSQGVKNKNLRILGDRPLIAHSIAQAAESGLFQMIAVSSDSEDILQTATRYGAHLTIRRPDEMASHTAPKVPAILHAVQQAELAYGRSFDTLVDLDATSPLRIADDIAGAVQLLEQSGAGSVITAAPAHRSPYFNLVELDKNGLVRLSKPLESSIVRRQDAPKCFDMNASIYVWQRERFIGDARVFYDDTRLFEMPEERSRDIDSELDFDIVSFLHERATREANDV